MPSLHSSETLPSPELTLVALGIVHRRRPEWLSVTLTQAASSEGQSAERICRLVRRAVSLFEPALQSLVRRGRPVRDRDRCEVEHELVLCQALLALCTKVLSLVPLKKRAVASLIVGAYKRLETEVSQERFCQALALSTRTFRSWLKSATNEPTTADPVVEPQGKPKPPRKRPLRRPRFGFDVTLPDTQFGADTTDLKAFGVPLKLIGVQDIGGRDEDLFDCVLIDESESKERVIDAFTAALKENPGAQAITDQGSVYMAEATKAALEALSAEHAPQKEADPTAKSTVERAFLTAKSIAAPLLSLTDRLAESIPALRDASVAKAAARLLISTILRAYQHGARASRKAIVARGSVDPAELKQIAHETRELARAEERSQKLWLAEFHARYDIKRPLLSFIRSLRGYPLEVLREAERGFCIQLHRNDIRDRATYFGAIVRNVFAIYRQRLARQRDDERQCTRRKQDLDTIASDDARHRADPESWLHACLAGLAALWLPASQTLLFGGAGPAAAALRQAVRHISANHGPLAACDMTRGALHRFCFGADPDDAAARALSVYVERVLHEQTGNPNRDRDALALAGDILNKTGRNARPPPEESLRN
jgi:hypothetical protein